jgi:hypothetical protein
MPNEDLIFTSLDALNTEDDLVFTSLDGIKQKKPPVQKKLPANLNPQQVKRFFSQAGKTITDTEARELAGMVSGKSFEEATSLAGNYLRPKPQVSEMQSQFQPMQQEQPVEEQAPLVAAPQPGTGYTGEQGTVDINQEPDFGFSRVGQEIARPKTAFETEQNISQTMLEEYKGADKDLKYIFDAIDNGKLSGSDLNPFAKIAMGLFTDAEVPVFNQDIFGYSREEIALMNPSQKEALKEQIRAQKAAEKTSPLVTNFATIKSIQEESTKNIAALNNEVLTMLQDPLHDKALLKKKTDELYDQININQVSNFSEKPLEDRQLAKNIKGANIAIKALPLSMRGYIATKNAVLAAWEMSLPILSTAAEYINKTSDLEQTGDYEEGERKTTRGGDFLDNLVARKRNELEQYRKSNKTEYLAGQVSILDGLNAVNVGTAIGQTVGSMGAVIGGSMLGGGIGGAAVGYSLVYGDAVKAAREAGYSESEAEIYGQLLAVGSGLLEELPVGKLLDGWTNSMLKRSVMNTIRAELRAGVPKNQIYKKVLEQTLEAAAKGVQQGIPEAFTEMAQGGQEYFTQIAFNNLFKDKEDPGFDVPSLKQFGRQSAEAGILGFFGGGGASIVGDVFSGSQSYSKLARAAINDNETFNNLNLIADGLLTAGKITKQERDSFVGNLKIAQEAKAALPKYVKNDDVRQRSIELILQKKRLEADMATVDPSMHDGYKAKLSSIQSELKSIADQKWKAPANAVVFTTVSGMEAMTTELVNNSSKENAAGTFVSTVESGKGFISTLIKSLENNEPLPKVKADRTVASLEALAKSFAEAPVKTEMTQRAAKQAQELADQVKQYSNITESAEQQKISGLDFSSVSDRISLSVPISELDSIAEVPADIQEAYQGIMNGDDVSAEDANNIQDVLYEKFKDLNDIKDNLEDRLEKTTSENKQKKLSESINAINEMQRKLSDNIDMVGKYRDETAINNEASGKTQTSKTKPVLREEAAQEETQTEQKPSREQKKYSEEELADMEYDYSNPSDDVTSTIDNQPDASKIYKLLNNAIKFINKIAPNVKIYVHATSQDFYDAVYSTSGKNEHNLSDDASFVMGNDGKPKAIHFNLAAMLGKKDPMERVEALRTFAHEAMHVGLHTIFGNDQKLFKSFQDKLGKILNSADLAFLDDFIENYRDPNKEDVTAEEFLAELGGMMSAEGRKIPKPILARIAQLINNTIVSAARKLGITVDSNLLFKDTMDTNDVIDFFNTMAQSTQTGITQGVQAKAEALLKQQTKNIVTDNQQVAGQRQRKTSDKTEQEKLKAIFGEESKIKKDETARRIAEQQEIDGRPDRRTEDLSRSLETYSDRSRGTRGVDKRDVRETKRLRGLNVNVIAEYNLDDKIESDIKKAFPKFKGLQKIYEITNGDQYRKLLVKALQDNIFAASVTVHSAEDFNDMRMFVSEDGGTGLTLNKEGYVGGGFSDAKLDTPNNLAQLMVLAVKEGATTMEAFDTVLPNYYSKFGFKAVSKTEFNDEYRPMKANGTSLADWDYEVYKDYNKGRPDIVFFIYDGGDRNTIEDRIGEYQNYKNYEVNNTKSFSKDEYDSAEEVMKQQAVKRLEYDIENNVTPTTTTRARRSAPTEADPAKVASEQMPMSASNILYNDSEELPKPEKKIKNSKVAIALQNAAADFWGGSIITSETITPEQEKLITENGIQEAIDALEQDEVSNASNWYSTAIQTAIAVAGVIHTELVSRASAMKYEVFAKEKDPEAAARMALRMALAITSQNLNVDANTQYAEEQFDYFKKNGRFDSSKKYGAKAPAISSNLELANTIIDKMGLNAAEEFISNGFTVAALEVAFKEATGKKVKISGLRNDDVNGAAIFGPKIGQGFLQNLMGKFDPVTIDLWMRRTWGRWTGDVVGDGVTEKRMARLYMTVRQAIKNKELDIKLPPEFLKFKPVQVNQEDGQLIWSMDDKFSFERENNVDFVNALNKIADEIRLIADNHYKNIHYLPMTKEMYAKFLSGEISYVQASNKLKALNERQKEKYKVYVAAQKAKGLKPLALNDKKVKDGETILGWLSTQNKKDGKIFIPTNEEISARKPEWGNAAKNIVMDLNPIDIPSNQDRRVITRVVNNIRKGLAERGYEVTNADVQAILWYPEKDIWAKLRGEEESNLKLSYDNQFIKIATERGLGEQAEAVAKEIRGGGAERTSTAPDQGPNGGVRGVANAESTTRARRTQVDKALEAYPELANTKVVNDDGKPIVVYQGRSKKGLKSLMNTKEKISQGWFSVNRRVAVQYADMYKHLELFDTPEKYETISNDELTGEIYKTYLDIKNPMYVDLNETKWNREKENAKIKEAKDNGNDGLIITQNGKNRDFVVFDENQTKSAEPGVVDSIIESGATTRARKTQSENQVEATAKEVDTLLNTFIQSQGGYAKEDRLSANAKRAETQKANYATKKLESLLGFDIGNLPSLTEEQKTIKNNLYYLNRLIGEGRMSKYDSVEELVDDYKQSKSDGTNPELVQAVEQSLPNQESTTRARRTQGNSQYYDPDRAADKGTSEDRKQQQKIYDIAKAFVDKFNAEGGDRRDMQTELDLYLQDMGYDLNIPDVTLLVDHVTNGNRPKYTKSQGGEGYTSREGQETRKSRVLDRIITKLSSLGRNKQLNKRIVNELKKSLRYTVENQEDAMRVAQLVIEEFGGIDGPQDVQDLFDLSNEFTGAVKTFIVGNVLNEAYRLTKKSEKGSDERKRYQNIVDSAANLLAERARENGREIAALYRLYLNSPEGMYMVESQRFLQDVQKAFATKRQQQQIDKLTKELKDAREEATRVAAASQAVKDASRPSSGGTRPSRPSKPATEPVTDTEENIKKERSLFKQLKDRLKAIGGTRARRQYPAGVDAEVVDILAELARVNFKRGIFNYFDIKDAITKKLAKDNITISVEHFQEMWDDIWREAAKGEVAYNSDKLAKRIIKAAQKEGPTVIITDPIKLIKDELFKRATQDLEGFKDEKESEFIKLRRLLFNYESRTKPIWDAARAAVEQQIEDLDPEDYSDLDKADLKKKLDSFFNDTLADALPRSRQKITDTFKEDVKDRGLKIEAVLLKSNEIIAANKEEFVNNLTERLVENTFMSDADARAIAEAFSNEYDMLAQKTAEKLLSRNIPTFKSSAKILKKSSAEKAFEMIKYGAVDIGASITDADGNLTDLNVLFAEIFGLPQITTDIRDNLLAFAEQIAKTKPDSILRQQYYNDMMSYMEFQKIRDVNAGSILLAQIYNNVLLSLDTMQKAFNSNFLLMPVEYLTQAIRATFDGDFSLIPLLTKIYFGRKGDKNTEVYFREGFNNAKLTLAGMVETEKFNTVNIAEIYSKQNDSPALAAWGKYARKSGRFLGALDTLFTSAAANARHADLLYDEIKYQAKLNGITLTSKQIADSVSNILGIRDDLRDPLLPSPVASAITEAKAEFEEIYGPGVNINDKDKIRLFRARVMEIVREEAKGKAANYLAEKGINIDLDLATIEELKALAKELASKIGLMGTPPGSWGALSTFIRLPGLFAPGSQTVVGNMFANAPMNAADKLLQGNTLIGGGVLITRLMKNQRGILNSKEITRKFYDSFGIRTEMYGRTTSTAFKGKVDVNMEKKEMIARYTMVQLAVLPLSYMAVTAITGAIAKALEDDEEKREEIIRNGIIGVGKLPENERHMLFYGDKTAKEGTEEYEGQWKKLGLYVTGPMYGYTAPGAYSKMTALKSMYGVEPYCIYSYGRLITRYNDNPILAAVFGSVGANSDVILFNNNPEKPSETWTDMAMMSAFLQLSLVKDQAAIKPIMELVDAASAKGVYSTPELEGGWDRASLLLQKKFANIVSNIALPAQLKNLNQDIKSILGMPAMDPRTFREFMIVRAPIMDLLINQEKTDSFGFPIEEKTKMVLPVGTQGLMYVRDVNGNITFPQVDQIMNGAGAKYYALFLKYGVDKYDKPDISNYVEIDPKNTSNSKVVTLTIDQRNQVRDEYKKIMREFCDTKYNAVRNGTKAEFNIELGIFLGFYNNNPGGYKDYIIKKVIGPNAFANKTVEELVNDAVYDNFKER